MIASVRRIWQRRPFFVLGGAVCLGAAMGCTTIIAMEPVDGPPYEFRHDVAVQVEFLSAARVGRRCAERGVKFLGMPGYNSGGCADATLMTVPNPCDAQSSGWYARLLCHELGHVNGWPSDHSGSVARRDEQVILPAAASPEARNAEESRIRE